MNRSKIKDKAKDLIRGKLWEIWKPLLIVMLVSLGISLVLAMLDPSGENPFVATLITISSIFLYPLTVGTYKYYLDFVRGKELNINVIWKSYKDLGGILLVYLLMFLIIGAFTILFVIPGIIMSFAYVMVPYLMADDEIDGMNTLRKSFDMIRGYKFDFFIFGLSFILWILLVSITFGIAIIYVGPYITVSQVIYYDELKKINKKKN